MCRLHLKDNHFKKKITWDILLNIFRIQNIFSLCVITRTETSGEPPFTFQRVFGSHGNNSSSFYDVRLSPNLSPRSFPNKRDELLAERGDFLWTCRFGARYTSPEIQIRERSERDRNKVVGETNQSRKRFFTCTQCIDCAQPSNAIDCRRFFQFFFFLFFPFSI